MKHFKDITVNTAILIFLNIFIFSSVSYAADFQLEQYNEYTAKKPVSAEGFTNGIGQAAGSMTASVVEIGFYLFAIMFVCGVVALAAAITLKHGQWMKWATNTMIFTMIAILLIRLGPILFLTLNLVGFKLLLQYTISTIVVALFYISVGMLLVSLFLKMLHQMFEHPKYFKWSRNLFNGSIIVLLLSTFAPIVIGNL